jgi:CheY-like chemotaxis protein
MQGQPEQRRSVRVLVVDDCPDTTESLRMLLSMWGHAVCVAGDGAEALDAAVAFGPEVVLLDIALPGMDGYQVAARLRQLPGLRDVTLVAATGLGQARDVRRACEAGFDLHLVKPFEAEDLRDLLAACGRRGGQAGEARCCCAAGG